MYEKIIKSPPKKTIMQAPDAPKCLGAVVLAHPACALSLERVESGQKTGPATGVIFQGTGCIKLENA